VIGVLAALVLLAAPADHPEQAALLERLASGTLEERRAAVGRLGEIGNGGATAALARALHDPDPEVRAGAGPALWAIWHRSGDPAIDQRLQEGIALMEGQRFPEAVAVFGEVIARAPDFAEGWNKRATVLYLMGDYDRSLADCEEVIRRNPIHYGALSGFGLNYLQKDDLPRAAQYFERALAVNPNLRQIEAALAEIREVLRQRRLNSVEGPPPVLREAT
jgi:tetratricopeptide (TPR) repeat protein